MTDYAMFANARTFAHVLSGELHAKSATAVADALRRMAPGDHVVPLYEPSPVRGADEVRALDSLADAILHVSGEQLLTLYDSVAGSVPHILRITGSMHEGSEDGQTAVVVPAEAEELPEPLRSVDFLRLRALSETVASQFKGAAPARPVQEVPRSLIVAVRAAATPAERNEDVLFRNLSLVAAQNTEAATQLLTASGRAPREGDMAFLVTRATMPGLSMVDVTGNLTDPQQPITRTPEDIKALLIDAERKATPSDPFNATPAIEATGELLSLLNTDEHVRAVDNFADFYNFRLLSRAVTQAIDLAKRPLPAGTEAATDVDNNPEDLDTAAALQGLSVEAVLAELPDGFSIERSVIAAAVASLRAGKHLLLGGPPGTGKTTLAEALCRAVVSTNYYVTTATADWTTFDTVGGYLPSNSGLTFQPGVILRSLHTRGWLIIDEVNRADIDKAFGPLFTVLSGGEGTAGRTSVLPYTTADGKSITITWSSRASNGDGSYAVTPSWRLIGTLNTSDKASLFRLSFAFLRRFAVIDLPLPREDDYRALFARWFTVLGPERSRTLSDLAMSVVGGPVPIGPAIGRDFAQLIIEGLAETASGEPTFSSTGEAFLTATRLLVVPQYEGQPLAASEKLLRIVDEHIGGNDSSSRASLEAALSEVALS